jgi:hypothetical protein
MSDTQDNSAQMYRKLMRYFLEREIENFHIFLKTLDESLKIKEQGVANSIDVAYSNLYGAEKDDERRKELVNLLSEADQVKGFTNLFRQSFLTSLYSFMELWLMRHCHLDSKRRDGGKSYKAAKGKGIEKFKNYFSNIMVSDYQFGSSQDWLWIKNFQLLRDCIIHRQGSLTGFSDFEIDLTLVKFVDNESGLNLFGIDNKQIFIEREFCLGALQIVHRFMVEVLDLQTKTD